MKIMPENFSFLSSGTTQLIINTAFFVVAGILFLITIYNLSLDFMMISRLSVQKIVSQKSQRRKKSHRKS